MFKDNCGEEMPFFSVIIPVYNGKTTICKCIESVLEQLYYDVEIIIVDDGSTDDTLKLCQSYASTDDRIKVFFQENRGVSAARNLGIKKANGKYVIFLDSDDCVLEYAFKSLARIIAGNPAELYIAGIQMVHKGKITTEVVNNRFIERKLSGLEAFKMSMKYKLMAGVVWGKAFERSFLLENKLCFDDRLLTGEDNKFMFQVFERANTVVFGREIIYQYNIGENTLTTCKAYEEKSNRYNNSMKVIEYLNKCLQKYSGRDAHLIKCYINRLLISTVLNNGGYDEKSIKVTNKSLFIYEASMRDRIKALFVVISPSLYLNVRKMYDKVRKS